MSNGPFLYPNVTSLPGQTQVGAGAERAQPKKTEPGEFDRILDRANLPEKGIPSAPGGAGLATDLSQIRQPLKFSAHASQRMQERKIRLDEPTLARVNDAVDKAAAKGIEDTLVLTGDAALIVSVKNRTVVTAMDKAQLTGNVFTNIDGAVIV
jgi:flagellar operon protein